MDVVDDFLGVDEVIDGDEVEVCVEFVLEDLFGNGVED